MRNRMPSDPKWFFASHARNAGADAKLIVLSLFEVIVFPTAVARDASTVPTRLLAALAWPARAALFSHVARWRARARPKRRADQDRRRAARASTNRRARRGRSCPGFLRAYRRRAGCLRARSRGCSLRRLSE